MGPTVTVRAGPAPSPHGGGAAVPLMPPKMGDKWFCISFSPVCRQRVKSTPHGVIRSPQANDDTGQTMGTTSKGYWVPRMALEWVHVR